MQQEGSAELENCKQVFISLLLLCLKSKRSIFFLVKVHRVEPYTILYQAKASHTMLTLAGVTEACFTFLED